MCVDSVQLPRHSGSCMTEHGQRYIEVVVRMGPPRETERLTQLSNTNRAFHSPEMGICKWNIDRLEHDRMSHLSPIGCNHIRCSWKTCCPSKLSHHLSTGERSLSTARVFTIRQHLMQILRQSNSFTEAPSSIRIDGTSCFGKGFF